MSTTENLNKNELIEIEVIIPEEVLKENEGLQYYYDREKKILSYELGTTITKDFKTKLSELMQNSTAQDIVIFNPIIEALAFLQDFKELKYDPEKKNHQEYIDAIKMIGKFNSASTAAGKALKDPKNAYTKMVVAVEKLIKEESDNIKKALETNFEPYLTEKEKEKQARIAKRDAEKDKMIAELSEQNAENLNKLNNQQQATRKVEIENEINKISADVASKIPTLNLAGLQALRAETLEIKLPEIDTPEITFSDVDKTVFRQAHARAVLDATALIDAAIKSFEGDARVKELESENQTLKASAGLFDDGDEPFTVQQPVAAPEVEHIPENDMEKLDFMVNKINYCNAEVDAVMNRISELEFEDKNLVVFQQKIQKAMQNIQDLLAKTDTWTKTKSEVIINYLNQ